MAERLHAIINASAPALSPRTWYGMPAYAKNANVICFLRPSQKFKTRYATLGFGDKANLDEGNMWPSSFALMELTAADETRVATLVNEGRELRASAVHEPPRSASPVRCWGTDRRGQAEAAFLGNDLRARHPQTCGNGTVLQEERGSYGGTSFSGNRCHNRKIW
jgi:hypothetical protein